MIRTLRHAAWYATVLALISCTEPTTIAVDTEYDLLGVLNLELLACTPLPPDSVTQAVGPAGGAITLGPHALTVPPNALDSAVAITVVLAADSVNRLRFAPAGLRFAQAAQLSMSYANCETVSLTKRVVQVGDDLALLDLRVSVDLPLQQKVTASVDHFSNYAVAW